MAEAASIDGADLVLVCGGDGTVREVCAELAGTGIPIGIVPAGTGNLLARNLDIPLFIRAAIDVALTGQDRAIDMVEVSGDGIEDTHFMVMAGMGFDAAIMEGVNEDIKKKVGWIAYVFSGLKSLMFPAVRIEISVDGGEFTKHRARTVVVGNVGYLQAGMPLLPDASIDDGLLDIVILHPRKFLSWIPLAYRVLAKQRPHRRDHRPDDRPDRHRARVRRHPPPARRRLDRPGPGAADDLRARAAAGAGAALGTVQHHPPQPVVAVGRRTVLIQRLDDDTVAGERLHLRPGQRPRRLGGEGLVVAADRLDDERPAAGCEEPPQAVDRGRPDRRVQRLDRVDLDDQVEGADQVGGRVEQVADAVVDRGARVALAHRRDGRGGDVERSRRPASRGEVLGSRRRARSRPRPRGVPRRPASPSHAASSRVRLGAVPRQRDLAACAADHSSSYQRVGSPSATAAMPSSSASSFHSGPGVMAAPTPRPAPPRATAAARWSSR